MRIALSVLVSLFLVACVRTAAPAPGTPATAGGESALTASQRLVNKVEQLAADVGGQAGNCDHFATTVDGWVTGEGASVQALARESKQATMGAQEAASLDQRLTDALESVLQFASQCSSHPAAQSSFARFDQLIEGV